MQRNDKIYQTYVNILKKELVPATGCTEPVAIAFCAAKAREVLGENVKKAVISASGNIIKNVKSVVVPHTGGLRGVETAAAAGICFGDSGKLLEVISDVKEEQIQELPKRMQGMDLSVVPLDSGHVLDLQINVWGAKHRAMIRIMDWHTNIVEIAKDGEKIYHREPEETGGEAQKQGMDDSFLTVGRIVEFADTAELEDIRPILERQIHFNMQIAEEGMKNGYGARIGQVLLNQGDSIRNKAKALAAAGSDARMGGSELPVVINSGSGNQGITASVPVIVYAKGYGKSEDEMYRALLVSNLVTLHLKSGIGRLSAYCGAISAGVGAGTGIAYLLTKDLKVINHTIVNALAINSGIVCDGAKASCAAKIAMAVEAGILGFEMYQEGNQFLAGEGLVRKGVENTIENISILGHDGMRETDKKIIEMMTAKEEIHGIQGDKTI